MNEQASTENDLPRRNLEPVVERARKALQFFIEEPLHTGEMIADDIADLMSALLHLAVDAKVCSRQGIGYMQWVALQYFYEDLYGRQPDER